MKKLRPQLLQKAEIAFYFQKFDEAEDIYLQMDRSDLAIEMRSKLGDWFKVEKLVNDLWDGDPALMRDDARLSTAINNIGDYYADRHKWTKAIQYYAQVSALSRMFPLQSTSRLIMLSFRNPPHSPCPCPGRLQL